MDIIASKAPAFNNFSSPSVASPADGVYGKPDIGMKPESIKEKLQSPDQNSKKLSRDEISGMTNGLNDFMNEINASLHFVVHEKTHRMMVQVVNTKDQSVIKEIPAHELLDTLAAISDYIGILLDKKV